MRTLIDHACVVTMDDSDTVYQNGYVLTEDERIIAVGEGACALSYDERVDGQNGILLPAFVNAHCHVSMAPFRSLGDDYPDRLNRLLFPLERDAVRGELVYRAAKYGCAEMLLSGITTFCDMYYFEDRVAQACAEMGMRGHLGETVLNAPTPDAPMAGGGQAYLAAHPAAFLQVRLFPCPHAVNTCTAEQLVRAHDECKRHGDIFTLHASETLAEKAHFEALGTTSIRCLDDLGVLDEKTLLVHAINLSDADIALIAKRQAAVAHCIGSNAKAAKGVAPVKELLAAGVRVGLGTDGQSSGNTLSMFDQMRLVADFHKNTHRDRALFPAKQIVRMATRGGAEALGEKDLGQLTAGMRADLALVETDSVNMYPFYDPFSALCYSANASNVRHVMARGVWRVREKRLTAESLPALRASLEELMPPFREAARAYANL